MTQVEFIDTSTRDGDQSLWSATGLATADVLQVAPVIDQVGYHALDFTASTFIGISVRFHREDPWRRIRLVSAAMPNTPLGMITSGMRFISWVPAGEDVMALAFRLVARNGIRRLQVVDPSNDPARLRAIAALAHNEGIEEVVLGLTYSISPVHTVDYYAERAAALADCPDMGRLYLKDPGGLLMPAVVRELAPHFRAAAGARPTELHSHCTIGLAPLVYVEGVRAGFQAVHTGCGPLSRGTAQPEVMTTARNLEASGFTHGLDLEAQERVAEHFHALARRSAPTQATSRHTRGSRPHGPADLLDRFDDPRGALDHSGRARERFGTRISEEELLLRLTMPAEHVDAMLGARGRPLEPWRDRRNGSERAPIVELLRELERRPGISYLEVVRGGETVVWRRDG